MARNEFLKARLSPELKRAAQDAAGRQFLAEGTWLRQLIEREVRAASPSQPAYRHPRPADRRRSKRLYVKLRPDDAVLLAGRAQALDLAPATYAASALRSHLVEAGPVPTVEMRAVRAAVAELNQLTQSLRRMSLPAAAARPGGPSREELMAVVKAVDAVRVRVKAMLAANQKAWEAPYGRTQDL